MTGVSEPKREQQVTSTVELAEAFGLGSTLSKIDTTLDFVKATVEKTGSTVDAVATDVSTLKVEQAGFREQLRSAFVRIEKLEQAPPPPPPPPAEVTRNEFEELRTEVKASRFSWPKLFAGAGGIMATLGIIAWIDKLTPGG